MNGKAGGSVDINVIQRSRKEFMVKIVNYAQVLDD